MLTAKELILNSAWEEFSRMGFSDARIDTIAENSGVNRVTVFRNFENKENLFQEVLEHFVRSISLDAIPDPVETDPAKAVMEICVSLLQWLFQNIHSFRIEIQASGMLEQEGERFSPLFARRICQCLLQRTRYSEEELQIPSALFSNFILAYTLDQNKNLGHWELTEEMLCSFREELSRTISFLLDSLELNRKTLTGQP